VSTSVSVPPILASHGIDHPNAADAAPHWRKRLALRRVDPGPDHTRNRVCADSRFRPGWEDSRFGGGRSGSSAPLPGTSYWFGAIRGSNRRSASNPSLTRFKGVSARRLNDLGDRTLNPRVAISHGPASYTCAYRAVHDRAIAFCAIPRVLSPLQTSFGSRRSRLSFTV
jgi:hypothetical protein